MSLSFSFNKILKKKNLLIKFKSDNIIKKKTIISFENLSKKKIILSCKTKPILKKKIISFNNISKKNNILKYKAKQIILEKENKTDSPSSYSLSPSIFPPSPLSPLSSFIFNTYHVNENCNKCVDPKYYSDDYDFKFEENCNCFDVFDFEK
jgi:hypothetical protein